MAKQSFYNQKHAEGYLKAHSRLAGIASKMRPVDHYQPSWAMNNMIKALNMMKWENTVDDWQRLEEAKIILQLRRRR